jgi:hypothetical protein
MLNAISMLPAYLAILDGAIFSLTGLLLLVCPWMLSDRGRFGFPLSLVGNLAAGQSSGNHERIRAALLERWKNDQPDPRLGRLAGLLFIGGGLASIAQPQWAGLILGAAGLTLSPVITYAYLHPLPARVKRAAEIRPRVSQSVISAPWFVAVFALAVMPALIDAVWYRRIDSAFIAASAAAPIVCAFWLSSAPSVISTADLGVERFIDDRLRRVRAATVLLLAPTAPLSCAFFLSPLLAPLVQCLHSGATVAACWNTSSLPLQIPEMVLGMIGLFVSVALLLLSKGAAKPSEVTRWSTDALSA